MGALVGVALITAIACTPKGSSGTAPPLEANGQFNPSQLPDFVAVAGRGQGIVGYVSNEALQDDHDRAWLVYASDLRTVVGTLVPRKGFVPIGADAAMVPDVPLVVGPDEPVPPNEPEGVLVFVRNASPTFTWMAVLLNGNRVDDSGVPGEGHIGAGCFMMPADSRLVILDRYVANAGARVLDTLFARVPGSARIPLAVDIDAHGHASIEPGVPAWWDGSQPSC